MLQNIIGAPDIATDQSIHNSDQLLCSGIIWLYNEFSY